jgi:hypothetical protein
MKSDKIYILIIFNGVGRCNISGSEYFCSLNKKEIYEKIAERDNTIIFDVYSGGTGVLYE